jgi:hypothetical protein
VVKPLFRSHQEFVRRGINASFLLLSLNATWSVLVTAMRFAFSSRVRIVLISGPAVDQHGDVAEYPPVDLEEPVEHATLCGTRFFQRLNSSHFLRLIRSRIFLPLFAETSPDVFEKVGFA